MAGGQHEKIQNAFAVPFAGRMDQRDGGLKGIRQPYQHGRRTGMEPQCVQYFYFDLNPFHRSTCVCLLRNAEILPFFQECIPLI